MTVATTIISTIPSTITTTIPATTTLTTIPTTQLMTSIPESTIIIECPEKCDKCDIESNKLELCISCNTNKQYYPINYNNFNHTYYECIKLSTNSEQSNLYSKFFFNPKTKSFNLCYETCKTCEISGNPENHNCKTCDTDHLFIPAKYPLTNCVTECKYYYYFTYFGQYKCTSYPKCPEEAKLFIKEKNKCLDDCLKDNDYKYQYNGNCLKECPEDTIIENYLCKNKDPDLCSFTQNELNYLNLNNDEGIETMVKSYSEEFSYTNNQISQYLNKEFSVLLFKNSSCIGEFSIKISNFDFSECYNKVKLHYNIEDDLIIGIIENIKNSSTSIYLFEPNSGKKLDIRNICMNDTVVLNHNLFSLLNESDPNYETLVDLINQGINIFDIESDFYSDLCFYFISPIKKDIPLKDRLQAFYPNITLCDSGCKTIGVNFTSKSAICECKYNDLLNNDLLNNEALSDSISTIKNMVDKSNIEVLKCLKYAFKYFKKNYGGYITIALCSLSIICTIIFYIYKYSQIQLYMYNLTQSYISILFTKTKNNIQTESNINLAPPKKNQKYENKEKKSDKKKKNYKNKIDKYDLLPYKSKKTIQDEVLTSKSTKKILKHKKDVEKVKDNEQFTINSETGQNHEEFFETYLSKDIDEMDFNDAYKFDKRSFLEIFHDSILSNVMSLNTFCLKESLRPMILKLIIYLLYINLFFIVNGIFYSEDYISQVYHLEKKDKFFTFVPRSFSRFIYTFMVSTIIQFIIKCLFIEEKRFKRILIREKDNINELKYEMIKLINIMKERLITFFVINFIIYIFSFFYVICFNYVYHFTQFEWIKSSIFIIIVIDLCIIFICFLCSGLRLLSFKCKNDRIYKLSNFINRV